MKISFVRTFSGTSATFLAFDHIEIYRVGSLETTTATTLYSSLSLAESSASASTPLITYSSTTIATTFQSQITTSLSFSDSTTANYLLKKLYSCDFDETDCSGVPNPSFDLNAGGVYFNLFSSFTHSSFRSLSDVTSISNIYIFSQ
jgi:hypothetical protein